MKATAYGESVISFGPFVLTPAKRKLERDGTIVRLGGRALDILIMLAERAGETVSKHDLMKRVWPNVVVDQGSLRFHMTALRRALGDSQSGNRYIVSVPGQGYCFVATVNIPLEHWSGLGDQEQVARPRSLPDRPACALGREETIKSIIGQLLASRFVTIAGAGGIGKTTVALAVAHALGDEFDGVIHFIGLGQIEDPELVLATVVSSLGLRLEDEDPTLTLIAFLRPRRMLLVIDCCEHVVDSIALLIEKVFKEARTVYLLTTSRETLRVQGETVFRLGPLETPPETQFLSADEALLSPAVQLFVKCVRASLSNFSLTDATAPIVAEICRRLDGIPLAIELAAGQVEAFGIQGTASLLEQRIRFHWLAQRTALPRHQTLKATLDWSYNLLNRTDREVLAILSVFSGYFTLEAIQAIAGETLIEGPDLIASVSSLVSKSLLTTRVESDVIKYRMLDTTRSFATEKRDQLEDADKLFSRLVDYLIVVGQAVTTGVPNTTTDDVHQRKDLADDIRHCLKWALTERRDVQKGITLFLASCSIFPLLSLVPDWLDWADEAIAALPQEDVGGQMEFSLQIALAMLSIFTAKALGTGLIALERAEKISKELADPRLEYASTRYLIFFLVSQTGEFKKALGLAERLGELAEIIGENSPEEANDLLAMTLMLTGDLSRAEVTARRSSSSLPSQVPDPRYYDKRLPIVNALVLANVLWFRGYCDQAAELASQLLGIVAALRDPFIKSMHFIALTSILLWLGDHEVAGECIELALETAGKVAATQFYNIAMGQKGALAIQCGNTDLGISLLQNCLPVEVLPHESKPLVGSLAIGLAKVDRIPEALSYIEAASSWMYAKGAQTDLTELLRIKADVMLLLKEPDLAAIDELLNHAICQAQIQSSLSLELRAAMSIASLRCKQARHQEGRHLLWEVYSRFTEGFNSPDLRAAREMLTALDLQIELNDLVR